MINNYLEGKIPMELGSLPNLLELNFAKNYLFGTIPLSLGNLSTLHKLSLSHNNLVGNIPSQLAQLSNLEHLSLSFNNLSGMIFDTGSLEGPFGSFQVCNVQIYGDFVVHIGSFTGETSKFSVGDKVICKVDYDRRKLIAPNHTCMHMLNFALREVLGNHVDQKGSIVLPEKLRFDFSHGKPVKPDKLRKIASIVNEQIKAELDVFSKEATLIDAKRINGL
ncbi:alanine--tRNA ligase-like [Camellia sinensis]|uniref:alanine--tRNA ligase-like n=1 Tax=Camellia sinensis TaxID=4442 RepID=UPI0010365B3B|nr:alanine--tRNA ligase-like [Camellia sinensis]